MTDNRTTIASPNLTEQKETSEDSQTNGTTQTNTGDTNLEVVHSVEGTTTEEKRKWHLPPTVYLAADASKAFPLLSKVESLAQEQGPLRGHHLTDTCTLEVETPDVRSFGARSNG